MSKKKQGNGRLLFEDILQLLNNNGGKPLNYKQVAAALEIKDNNERQLLGSLLADLAKKTLIEEVEIGKYRGKSGPKSIEGTIDITQSGQAYVKSIDFPEEICISAHNTNGAMHGDKVKVKVFSKKRGDGRAEGEIIDVLQRARTEFAGTIHIESRMAFVSPDNKKFRDFLIPKDKIGKAKDGQKVVVKMTDWEDYSDLPQGEVIKVLGEVGNNDTEINAIMVEYGLPYEFPKGVEKIAELIPTKITEEEISNRKDFRKITTFTIDPFDAKDFDDALSVRKLENENWEIGVHIADVSHYVKPGSVLDKEGLIRATSVYLVDRVVPMLPEILSNNVCSLRPNEEKLTFSAVFELDENATVVKEWFGRTIINSDRRFTYEEVQEILEGKEGDFKAEIHLLDTLAKKLRDKRMKDGSITFEREEVKFHLDENGNPTGVYFKVMKDSNQLIEDFMLLANRRVAEYVALCRKAGETEKKKSDLRRPFVYRVHASPSPQKVQEFSTFVATFGYRMGSGNNKSISSSLNQLLKDVQGKPEANMIETLAIRTMAKAIYTTENIGHYGLGFHYYTHFTSPIRRYPDVMAHRLLQFYIDADAGRKVGKPADQNELEQECKHCSEREKAAAEAERASIKYKQVQFLQDKVGQEFDGIVSGVTEFGFFVELVGNKCEGMVHVRNLRDDRYVFEAEKYCMRGMRTGKIISLGDSVRVLIKGADLIKKQIDFELVGQETRDKGLGDMARDGGSRTSEQGGGGGRRKNPYEGKFSETSGKDDWNSPKKKDSGGGNWRDKKVGGGKRNDRGKDKGKKKKR
ncbi:MAG: ribonuclease R [Bacteroidetes bacterium]|nr:ribonuclease R [Bacteroidota bacterium]